MNKTEELYSFISQYISKNNYPPTIREMCQQVKLDSTSSVVYHLKKLESMGKITRNGNKNRAIELTDKPTISSITLPVVGTIAAGQPIASAPCNWGTKPNAAKSTPIPNTNGIIILSSRTRKVIAPL